MLIAQDAQGLVFYPKQQVCSITPAFPNRWRVVFADGTVAYHPGPLPAGPWQRLAEGYVLSHLLQPQDGHLLDAAGFPFPHPDQPHPSQPQDSIPQHAGLPCPAHQIWALEDNLWHTDHGPQPCSLTASEACQLHPDLRKASPTLYFNRKRLRRILQNKKQIQLVYDNQQCHQLTIHQRKYLLKSLNLTSLQQLEPFTPGLFRHFVREYPFELARASGATLRELFDHPDLLTANLIWQSRHYHQAGEPKGYGRDHRGFCYMPLAPALERAGFMRYLRSLIAEPKYKRFADLLARYVGDDRLFTYEEFGFEDQTAEHRLIGTRRPDIILLVEKSSLARFSRQQAQRLGISLFVSGGVSGLMAAEFFAKDLRRVYTGPVFVIALVDWDPGGATTAHSLVAQLARYDYPPCTNPAFLLRPELFTPQEIELFSRALHATDPREAGRIANWVKTTGGIHGQARGIRADCLHPLDRLLPQLESLAGA